MIPIDVKYLPPLNRQRRYAYVAIDRATRFVFFEILPDRRGDTAAGFLARFLDRFVLTVHTILTDNGCEFTDRFAVDKKAKPHDKPSGTHPFDRLCAARAITHRLTRPFRPQTNGLVERFNRRLGDHLARMPQTRAAHHRRFHDHAERDAYLHTFVANYNRTRLRCLDIRRPPNSSLNLRDTTPAPGVRTGCTADPALLPVRVLSRLFRRLFLTPLADAHAAGRLAFFGEFDGLRSRPVFAAYLAPLRKKNWFVYGKPAFARPEAVLAYLARYTHRVAISNSRLVGLDDRGVTFGFKDYRRGTAR